MSSNWIYGVLAGLVIVAGRAAIDLAHIYQLQSRLRLLRTQRDNTESLALCQAQFSDLPPDRVAASYAWVQSLVAVKDIPLLPDDELERELGLDQGEIDAKFEASYECYGEQKDRSAVSRAPLRTVKDLMAAVLAERYENYPSPEARAGVENAA